MASLEVDAEAEFGPRTLFPEIYQLRNLNEGKEKEQEWVEGPNEVCLSAG